MGLFSRGTGDSGGKPASAVRSANLTRAAKAARRGGNGIRVPQKAAPAQFAPAKRGK